MSASKKSSKTKEFRLERRALSLSIYMGLALAAVGGESSWPHPASGATPASASPVSNPLRIDLLPCLD